MSAPVNIYASCDCRPSFVSWLLFAVLATAVSACAGRPALDQAWFEPNAAALNSGVGQVGAMPPSSDDARRTHVARLDRQWAAEEVEVLRARLHTQKQIAGLTRPEDTSGDSQVIRKSPSKPSAAPGVASRAKRASADKTNPRKRTTETNEPKKPSSKPKAVATDIRKPTTKPLARTQSLKPKVAAAAKPRTQDKKRHSTAPPKTAKTKTAKTKTTKPKTTKPRLSVSVPDVPVPVHAGLRSQKGDRSALGDGSMASEMVAAARRLIGLRYVDTGNTFLRHLLVSAAVELKFEAPLHSFDGLALVHMIKRGWRMSDSALTKGLRQGDLVVFDEVVDNDGDGKPDPVSMVAVVERFDRKAAVATCIGVVAGKVMRFALSIKHPRARRNEAIGVVLNDRIVGARRGRVLAGELFHLAIRPAIR